MKLGITGASGFIGYHLSHSLDKCRDGYSVLTCGRAAFYDDVKILEFVSACDCIVHLGGENTGAPEDVYAENMRITRQLLGALEETSFCGRLIFASSNHEYRGTRYGDSKRESRLLFQKFASMTGALFHGLIIPNVYGPFCRPHYNSVVATFCHDLTHGRKPQIKVDAEIELVYVNELISQIIACIDGDVKDVQVDVVPTALRKVSDVLGMLERFKKLYFDSGQIPNLDDAFKTSLFSTFQSYMDVSVHPVALVTHDDERGSLCEVVKGTQEGGQVFFSTTQPGATRGQHFHTRKFERFVVVKGKGLIRLRQIGQSKVYEIPVCGDAPAVVDIPVWFTHSITNVGTESLLTVFFSDEVFDPSDADTYEKEV